MKAESIRACSIWRALEEIGDVATLLILERAFLGTRTFEGFVRETRLPRSVVSARLKRLLEGRTLARVTQKHSRRSVYLLAEKGRSLFAVALAMLRWQHLWEPHQRHFSVRLVHSSCGHATEPVAACRSCGGGIDARDVTWREGPGLSQVTPFYVRRRRPRAGVAERRDRGALVDTVIEIFGDRWATLVLRAIFTGINRFDEIQRDAQMASNILSDRLERLLALGMIRTERYSDHAERFDYRLTDKGLDLYPVILAMFQWGDRWFADEKGPPILLNHTPCGASLDMEMRCSHCAVPLTLNGVEFAVQES